LISADVTEIHNAQKELQESRALFEHLFESDPDANILVDEGGKITAVNHQVEMDFGYSRSELIGKSIELLIPNGLRQKHAAQRRDYQHSPHKQFMGYEKQIAGRRKNGDEFPLEVTLSPLKTENATHILAVARDISIRKQLEREMAEVQHRLIESTETERLHLAQDLHDGPIQDLYGAVYMLQSMEEAIAEKPEAHKIQAVQEAVSQVIDTLREVCSELRPTALLPFGLNRAITSHAENFQNQFPGLTFHLHLDEDHTDLPEQTRLALYRIYQHLVSNVQRHAHAKNLWVRFQMGPDEIVLEVEDDGIGFNLPRRYVELVREGHFGLAGATERAQAIGGNAEIITAPGKGTRIRIAVPAGLVYIKDSSISIQNSQ
jgi:PAS domain S-box-containing protein